MLTYPYKEKAQKVNSFINKNKGKLDSLLAKLVKELNDSGKFNCKNISVTGIQNFNKAKDFIDNIINKSPEISEFCTIIKGGKITKKTHNYLIHNKTNKKINKKINKKSKKINKKSKKRNTRRNKH